MQGEYLKAALKSVRAEVVKEVRGRGLMIAIELYREAGGARRYCEALAKRGVLATDAHDHIIRISSPLVIKTRRGGLGDRTDRSGSHRSRPLDRSVRFWTAAERMK
jgi:acetylornithine/succinyldiaminopimelate/putrescine aminotransferase